MMKPCGGSASVLDALPSYPVRITLTSRACRFRGRVMIPARLIRVWQCPRCCLCAGSHFPCALETLPLMARGSVVTVAPSENEQGSNLVLTFDDGPEQPHGTPDGDLRERVFGATFLSWANRSNTTPSSLFAFSRKGTGNRQIHLFAPSAPPPSVDAQRSEILECSGIIAETRRAFALHPAAVRKF